MIMEGVRLMALGMTMVFVFLALLVGVMSATAWFFQRYGRYFPEATETRAARPAAAMTTPASDSSATVAAVVAAIHAYRARQGRR